MKKIIILLISLTIFGCKNSYEKEEFNAIQSILNNYLKLEYLENKPFEENENIKSDKIYNTKIKVYISDALIPISQIKEDEYWMFTNNFRFAENKNKFNEIINSTIFKKLRYREIKKKQIELINPYEQSENSRVDLKNEEKYNILSFSRVCFDYQMENGIVVINESIGRKGGKIQGNHKVLLIKKVNGKWVYIKENQNDEIVEILNSSRKN
jgi:hypothetical protein